MRHSRDPKRGFTLIELLVVIAIIAILSSMLIAAISRAIAAGKRTKARAETKQIVAAFKWYKHEYAAFPPWGGVRQMDSTVLDLFRGENFGPGSGYNPRTIAFLENAPSGATWLDPWGTNYFFALDLGAGGDPVAYDGVVEILIQGVTNTFYGSAGAWSMGPKNGLGNEPDEPSDDIKSWHF